MKVGDIIDEKYEVVRLLGEGGMGQVFEGRHTRIGRRVALKVLRPQHSANTALASRFLREAQAAAAIGSDHIVDIYDEGETPEGAPYLVMEFLEGEDFHEMLDREGRLDPRRACELVIQACRGVAAAHQRGIIHRDLKPDNIFITSRDDGVERVKIVDFGIAKFRDTFSGDEPRLTSTGAAVGTPYYMSPEQARADEDLDHRTDIYSLGVILYEVLTGRLPFTARSFSELVIMIATSTPPLPREVRPDLPEALEQVVMKAMARRRNDRYASIGELVEALDAFFPTPDTAAGVEKASSIDLDEAPNPLAETCLSSTKDEPFEISGEHRSDFPDSTGTPLAWQSEDGEPPEPLRRRSAGRIAALVIIVVVAALGALWMVPGLTREGRSGATDGTNSSNLTMEPPAELAGDATTSSASTGTGEDAGSYRLEVHVEPATAELRVDGVVTERLPFVGSFPRDGEHLRLEAFAEGFEPHTRYVTLDEDRVETIELVPSDNAPEAGTVDRAKVPPTVKIRRGDKRPLIGSPYE